MTGHPSEQCSKPAFQHMRERKIWKMLREDWTWQPCADGCLGGNPLCHVIHSMTLVGEERDSHNGTWKSPNRERLVEATCSSTNRRFKNENAFMFWTLHDKVCTHVYMYIYIYIYMLCMCVLIKILHVVTMFTYIYVCICASISICYV